MRKQVWLIFLFAWICTGAACSPGESDVRPAPDTGLTPGTGSDDDPQTPDDPEGPDDPEDPGDENDQNEQTMKIRLTIGSREFAATLEENAAARAFLALLPLEMEMTELNGNEKFFDLRQSLPTETFRPGTIREGDLLLWGSSTVVLFYKTFSSSYSYTRLGRLDDPAGLAAAVGSGDIRVTFAR